MTTSCQSTRTDSTLDPAARDECKLFETALRRFQSKYGRQDVKGNERDTSAPYVAYMRGLWRYVAEQAEQKQRPVYLYGAGEHSRWWLSITDDLPTQHIVGFIADKPSSAQLCGFPVVRADQVKIETNAILVLSSDSFEEQLHQRARELFGAVEIVRPYEGLPPGPYPKPASAEEIARRVEATRLARDRWGGSEFIGPYESAGYVTGFLEEQWLWANRELIRGRVLDMSTPRYWHQWIHDLPSVAAVSISDLDRNTVVKDGFASRVDVLGDFCADQPPAAADSFDTVLCLSILEHCCAPVKLLGNLLDTLTEGGTTLVVVPFAYIDGHCRPDYWRFGRDGLTLLAQQAGFRNVRTGTLGDVGPMLEDVLGLSLAARDGHDGIPLLTWLIAGK